MSPALVLESGLGVLILERDWPEAKKSKGLGLGTKGYRGGESYDAGATWEPDQRAVLERE